jgi:hypothetical protein
VYGTCRTLTGSPWSGPFPPPSPPLRSHIAKVEGALFNSFSGTIGLSDCSEAHMLGLRPWPSPAGLPVGSHDSLFRVLPVPTRHHWSSRHSSGPERIATPYSVEDLSSTSITRSLTSYSMPVLTGAFATSPTSQGKTVPY